MLLKDIPFTKESHMFSLRFVLISAFILSAGCTLKPVPVNPGQPDQPTPDQPTMSEPVSFTRTDHDICINWPVCPDSVLVPGITSPADPTDLHVLPESCRADFNIKISCGRCVDTSTPACKPFVGRCMAPNWPQGTPAFCSERVAEPRDPAFSAWTICTGSPTDGPAADTVCNDS